MRPQMVYILAILIFNASQYERLEKTQDDCLQTVLVKSLPEPLDRLNTSIFRRYCLDFLAGNFTFMLQQSHKSNRICQKIRRACWSHELISMSYGSVRKAVLITLFNWIRSSCRFQYICQNM
ncbi:MAG: hypothetical protein EXX96DRAFT_534758 [Benjaminiella poitrasii]|nr:MAG: hypothetical protein EXX96DRAFT_534758 [Benjaminiella poitrasii]